MSGDDLSPASTQGWTRGTAGADLVYTRLFAAGADEAVRVQAALSVLVFQPAAHVAPPGARHATTLRLLVADAGGSAGDATVVTITAAADQPVVANAAAAPLAPAPSQAVAPFAALSVSEPDDVPAVATVTVVGGVDKGDLAAASAAGFVRSVSGRNVIYTLALAAWPDVGAILQAALRALVFQPAAQAPGSATGTTISLAIGFAGLAAPAPLSVVVVTTSPLNPFARLDVHDADPDALVTVTASLPAGSTGHYADLGIGGVGADPLSYVATGTAAQVSAALHAVSFVPDADSTVSGGYSARVAGDGNQARLVDGGTGSNVLSATDTTDTVVGGAGPDTLYAAPASASVLIGGIGRTVFVGTGGPATVFSGAAGSVFFAGSTADVMVQSTGHDAFIGGAGSATVFGGTGRASVYGGTGSLDFEALSGRATVLGSMSRNVVHGGTSSLTVYGGGSGLYTGGAAGNNLLVSGEGDSTLVGGGDADRLVATGSGADVLASGAGAETLSGAVSTGDSLYFGGTGTATIAVGRGHSTAVGGTGADTIFANPDGGDLTCFGGAGSGLVVGSRFADTFVVGSGNETLVGNGGVDRYVVANGHAGGTVTVLGFDAARSTVDLFGYVPDASGAAPWRETTAGGSTTLLLADGTHMTFVGVTSVLATIR